MPARRNKSGLWAEQQPKYVEIPPISGGQTVSQDVRPQFEKMFSCDLSVEESFTTNDTCEEDIVKAMCGFPKKSVIDRCPQLPASWFDEEAVAAYKKIGLECKLTSCQDDPSSLANLEEKQAALKKLYFESAIWKVGAVESEKSRLPTEHDDRDEPKSIEDGSVDFQQNEGFSSLKNKPQTCTEHFQGELRLVCLLQL